MAEAQVTVDSDGTLMISIPLDGIPLDELLRCVMAARRGQPVEVAAREPEAAQPALAPRKRRGKDGERRNQVVELLSDGEPHQANELSRHMGITRDGVGYHLRALQKAGRVERLGGGEKSTWRLVP